MSVEAKIQEMLEGQQPEQLDEETAGDTSAVMQGSSEQPSTTDMQDQEIGMGGKKASATAKKDTSKAADTAQAGDTSTVMQGSSEQPSVEEMDELDIGTKAASSVSKDTTLPTSKGDAKSVDVKHVTEEEAAEEEMSIENELSSIFGEELSEEFKTKATSIFEAVVIARVNDEMEKVTSKLEEQAVEQVAEFKDELVEKVDNFLNYVVEQWMEENTLAVDAGLRTEIAEDFISGLKTLFTEHYIEVPEEKYEVMDELVSKTESLESKLDESIEENIELHRELSELKRQKVFEEVTSDLASTEVEKLSALVEGVEFDSEELYREKIGVIKENYFPKSASTSPEQVLVEESGAASDFEMSDAMSQYVQSLSRTITKSSKRI